PVPRTCRDRAGGYNRACAERLDHGADAFRSSHAHAFRGGSRKGQGISMMIQSVLDEVLANHFRAVVEEMSHLVLRAAHTTFVKATQDYATALITVEGEAFAYPYKTGVPSLMGIPVKPGIAAFRDWRPGDVMITNDPFSTEGMVMHLPDLHLLKPIFHRG